LKTFDKHTFSAAECKKELQEFKALLAANSDLEERRDILPFFRQRRHLSSFIATYVNDIISADRLAFEFELFSDFACDLAIGDSARHEYLLVEFEDAKKNSLFVPNDKYAPDWSSRLEHGFSQVIDWFWKLEDLKRTDDYEYKFGAKEATFYGLVIIGRADTLSDREKKRLRWRQDHVVVNSNRVSVKSFDQVLNDLEFRLTIYTQAADAKK